MMDSEKLEGQLAELPLLGYFFIDPKKLEFSHRVRWICEHECPMYGKTWACPPGVGSVESCRQKCLSYGSCLMIATATEVFNISDMEEGLATRPAHEAITNEVGQLLEEQGIKPYILSTEACAICEECTCPAGLPCRHSEKMHPCVESHGINLIPAMEENGLDFQFGGNAVTWISLLFY